MPSESAASPTRRNLVEAAIALFGQRGFAETSTREIAGRARTNIASIAYHFGGKAGLHMACAHEVARRIGEVVGIPEAPEGLTPEAAAGLLHDTLARFARFVTADPGARDISAFMLRELSEPGEAAELIYDEVFAPTHHALCVLWEMATGQPAESEATRLTVFAMVGQVLYFRIGQPFVLKRLGWDEIGPDEAERIATLLTGNLAAILERQRT